MTTTTSSSRSVADPISSDRRSRLRRGLAGYAGSFAVVQVSLVLIARANGADIHHLDDVPVAGQLALFAGAFVPSVAMLVAWLVSGIGPDWGLRRRTPFRLVVVAWALPIIAAAMAYVPAWLTGIAGFDADGMHDSFGGLPLPAALLVALGPALVPWIALAAAEQLGWSSWFVVHLAELRDRNLVAIAFGVGWCLAHVPMMLLVPGAIPHGIPVWFAVSMFLVQCVSLAYPLVWLRLESRSIWPVLVAHAGINASIYFVGDLLTTQRDSTDWFLGEGALFTAVSVALAVLLTAPWWRREGARG